MYRIDQYFREKLPGIPIKSTLIMVLDRLINTNSYDRGIIVVWFDQEIQKERWVAEVEK
jgi:dephospho-CoA kinase